MKNLRVLIALVVFAIGASGCNSGGAETPPATTSQDKLAQINKTPLPESEKQKLRDQVGGQTK